MATAIQNPDTVSLLEKLQLLRISTLTDAQLVRFIEDKQHQRGTVRLDSAREYFRKKKPKKIKAKKKAKAKQKRATKTRRKATPKPT
jgi:hypothetical protein